MVPLTAPSPTPRPTPSPTLDPFKWTRYSTSGGTAIFIPSTWTVPDIASSKVFTFAAAPAGPRTALEQEPIRTTLLAYRGGTPLTDVNDFADVIQRTLFANLDVVREVSTHSSGPVVFLKYGVTVGAVLEEQVDALFVRNGVGWILGSRAPADRWKQYAPTFEQIFQRFSPA